MTFIVTVPTMRRLSPLTACRSSVVVCQWGKKLVVPLFCTMSTMGMLVMRFT